MPFTRSNASRETLAQYEALLERWNATINLSAGRQRWAEHIEDSLRVLPYLPTNLSRLIDIGSGQGFPAIPLAIATGIQVDMIEADRRKAAFLTTVISALKLPGKVLNTRIETACIPTALCVTARALAPLSRLIALADRHVAVGGCCLFLKGPGIVRELEALDETLRERVEVCPTPDTRSFVVRVAGLRCTER